MKFKKYPDEFRHYEDKDFIKNFLHIVVLSRKDNTYKFALARFLLEYCESNPNKTEISFHEIAKKFLEYYWPQISNSKLNQGIQKTGKDDRPIKPEIESIVTKYFTNEHYHENFNDIQNKEKYAKDIEKCISKIETKCFTTVTYAFQRLRDGDVGDCAPMFFKYEDKGCKPSRPDQRIIVLDKGIEINPHAITFFAKHSELLRGIVMYQWAKMLESLNIGYPEIIHTIESEYDNRNLDNERKLLDKIHDGKCFYCQKIPHDDKFEVEHVIPYSYLRNNKMWNLVLACRNCNCKKLSSLPKPKNKWMDKLHKRNREFRKRIPKLNQHIGELGKDYENRIEIIYELAKNQGFTGKKMPPGNSVS